MTPPDLEAGSFRNDDFPERLIARHQADLARLAVIALDGELAIQQRQHDAAVVGFDRPIDDGEFCQGPPLRSLRRNVGARSRRDLRRQTAGLDAYCINGKSGNHCLVLADLGLAGSRPSFLDILVNLLGGVIRRHLNRGKIVDDQAERRENCVEFAL